MGERALGRQVSDEALEPPIERLPGIGGLEFHSRAADLLDLVDVQRLEQRLAIREVAVERSDSRPPRDERSPRARWPHPLGKRLTRRGQHLLVVAAGIGSLGPG